jgi:hypothetical protein
MAKDMHEILADEARKVFDAQNEPLDSIMGKKLIINACVSGGFVNRTHNPNSPPRQRTWPSTCVTPATRGRPCGIFIRETRKQT